MDTRNPGICNDGIEMKSSGLGLGPLGAVGPILAGQHDRIAKAVAGAGLDGGHCEALSPGVRLDLTGGWLIA